MGSMTASTAIMMMSTASTGNPSGVSMIPIIARVRMPDEPAVAQPAAQPDDEGRYYEQHCSHAPEQHRELEHGRKDLDPDARNLRGDQADHGKRQAIQRPRDELLEGFEDGQ